MLGDYHHHLLFHNFTVTWDRTISIYDAEQETKFKKRKTQPGKKEAKRLVKIREQE